MTAFLAAIVPFIVPGLEKAMLGQGGPDGLNVAVDASWNLIPGSSTKRATRFSFDVAGAEAPRRGLGIGFVLSADDPYTCIDLDVKNKETHPDKPDHWTTQEKLDRYRDPALPARTLTPVDLPPNR